MTKATVGDAAPSVNSPLPGIPRGMLCRAVDVRQHMHWAHETWQLWRAAGLKTIANGKSEIIYTDHLIDFLLSEPSLEDAKNEQTRKRAAKKATPKKRSS